MSNILTKLKMSIENRGVSYAVKEAIPHVHRYYIRPYLPRKEVELNGVSTRSKRMFDDLVPWKTRHPDPDLYEYEIVSCLEQHVQPGDNVVIVGGGWGVSTVVAAKEAGENGRVRVYEASPRYSTYIKDTVEINDIDGRVNVENAVVSHTLSVYGSQESENHLHPSELPDCDILELDCEGAERNILKNLSHRPRIIIVESHGLLGSPTDSVVELLNDNSYKILSINPAEKGSQRQRTIENDVYVISAIDEKRGGEKV